MGRIDQENKAGGRWFSAIDDDNTPVGLAVSRLAANKVILDDLHVEKEFRGNGAGTALIEAVLSWAKSKGATEIEVIYHPYDLKGTTVEDIEKFYSKRGFVLGKGNNFFKNI